MKKIILNTKIVLQPLSNVAAVIGQKNTMPILDTIHLFTIDNAAETMMGIEASDAETWVTQYAKVQGDVGIDICINANDFLKGLRNIDEENVELNVDESNNNIVCKYSNGYFSMTYDNSSEFPKHNIDLANASEHELASNELLSFINSVQYAVGNDTLRIVLNTIHFDFFEDCLVAVATDGQRLAKIKDTASKNAKQESFNFPIKPANILSNILSSLHGDVKCMFNDMGIKFYSQDFILTTRLMEGRYPNYNSVIPTTTLYKAIVPKASLVSAIKRVSPMGNATSELLRFVFSEKETKVIAENIDFCKKGEETIPCKYNGLKMEIGFKSSHILQTVQNIDSEEIELNLTAPNRACLIEPTTKIEGVESVYLIMPLIL